jgi:putative heme-binding domain-containing protein
MKLATPLIKFGFISLACLSMVASGQAPPDESAKRLFARENLIAWCIVPFDSKKRGPEDRAEMLERLGFKHFAYDWRGEHVPTFDAEVAALKKHGVALDAWWTPGELNADSRRILDVLKRHQVKAQLWVLLDFGADKATGDEQNRRVEGAVAKLKPLADEAKAIGCSLALYNHGGWFGEPENQLAIVEKLKGQGVTNVGIVYNLHHGHAHLDRFPQILRMLMPHLVCVNLNGMIPNGEALGKKILPLGQGTLDLQLLKAIRDSGYKGPIGILGHTDDDAEERLRDNLDGLDWLVPQLEGVAPGPKPKPRTIKVAEASVEAIPFDPKLAMKLLAEAKTRGDLGRGAAVFASPKFGCQTCHKVGSIGGTVGPDLSTVGKCEPPEKFVEAVLWPAREVKEGFAATVVALTDGKVVQGYKQAESATELTLREAATGASVTIEKSRIEERREAGTLMPDGLASAMSVEERRDLIRFLSELGGGETSKLDTMFSHATHEPASFVFKPEPLHPEDWPNRTKRVNRQRLYDFYAKEADFFRMQNPIPSLLPQFPGLDGGVLGHWGNQNDDVWIDGRWNKADLGTVLCGVFRGAGVTVPKGVCVRIGDRGEMATCFNPETLTYDALWTGRFLKFSDRRHGFMDGVLLDGTPLPRPAGEKPKEPFVYHGFYRNGPRVIFSYRLADVEMLDSAWVVDGKFERMVGPAKGHPLADLISSPGKERWPQTITLKGILGSGKPYAVDTIPVPFENPWDAPMFLADHDFTKDGTAYVSTMQGDIWKVDGIDDKLAMVRWKKFAAGLHQPLGLKVVEGVVHVLGRDQITRLHDLNNDGEADFHECVSNAYFTSPAGHDFICGLERDAEGNFLTASGPQGILKIKPDGKTLEVLATGFRNPDGLGLASDGAITVPSSEGEWTPTSMISEIRQGGHYGYLGPKNGQTPDLPLVYLPRGVDNSSGAQTAIPDDRWGPLKGLMVHTSFGAGSHFLLLRDHVDGVPQGAVVPMPGDFNSGVHRAKFNPKDGQLYLSGMTGWGTYTPDDGCFQRVRYTGDPVLIPTGFQAYENGVMLSFSGPVDRAFAGSSKEQFAQCWNYRYSSAYGSSEYSSRHPGVAGHDALAIRSSHVMPDCKSLFLEIPDLQPVNQLHLRLRLDSGDARDLFATIHKLRPAFTSIPGYKAEAKTIAAHPMLLDLASAKESVPNRWKAGIANARVITIEAGKNLTFSPTSIVVKAGEPLKITFKNPDVVPHNWALIRPGTLARVGDLANKLIAEPDAASRHYMPKSDDLIAYCDVVDPNGQFSIYLRAPLQKGKYPYLCTFPGHWMIMNGVMIVE